MAFIAEGLSDLPPGYGPRSWTAPRLWRSDPRPAVSRLAALAAACDPGQIGAWVRDIDRRRIQPDVDQTLRLPGSSPGSRQKEHSLPRSVQSRTAMQERRGVQAQYLPPPPS